MTSPNATGTHLEFLALGDSYTVGTAVGCDERWPERLVASLRDRGYPLANPRIVAADGWTTDRLADEITSRSIETDYDLVTLLIGANGAYRGRPPEAFRSSYVDLLERSVAFAGGDPSRVVAVTIPDYTHTPHGRRHATDEHAERLDRYNRIVRQRADEAGVHLVDVVPISRSVADRPELVATDGLHPSAEQYSHWLERIEPAVVAALDGDA